MTQQERLDYLVEAFKADSEGYKGLQVPSDNDGKRRILRSLMNIRMPGRMPEDTLKMQDAYLKARAEEKGIAPPFRSHGRLARLPKNRGGSVGGSNLNKREFVL